MMVWHVEGVLSHSAHFLGTLVTSEVHTFTAYHCVSLHPVMPNCMTLHSCVTYLISSVVVVRNSHTYSKWWPVPRKTRSTQSIFHMPLHPKGDANVP